MDMQTLKNTIEAVLMVADCPLDTKQLRALFGQGDEAPDSALVNAALDSLGQDYAGRGIELKKLASGFRFQARAEYSEWIQRLVEEKPPRYSRALLETLAIIVYQQPVTRAEIEDIRGVSVSSNIIKTLQERNWIKVVGHRNLPGKPELLASTRQFLDYFNLRHLNELPPLEAIKDLDQQAPELFSEQDTVNDQASPAAPDDGAENTGPETLVTPIAGDDVQANPEDDALAVLEAAMVQTDQILNQPLATQAVTEKTDSRQPVQHSDPEQTTD